MAVVLQRLDDQDRMLERIFAQAAKTNGRVSELEKAKLVEEALRQERAGVQERNRRERATQLGQTTNRLNRKTMIVAAVVGGALGMGSSILGYAFLALAHIHP